MVLHPQNLGVAVVRVGAVARNALQLFLANRVQHPLRFLVGSAIHPDHARAYRLHVGVQRDARSAIQAGNGDAFDAGGGNPGFGHSVLDGIDGTLIPHVRPLFGPQRLGGQYVILLKILGDELTRGVHENGFGSGGADVGSE